METLRSCEAQGERERERGRFRSFAWSVVAGSRRSPMRFCCEAYDSQCNQWRAAPNLNIARAGARHCPSPLFFLGRLEVQRTAFPAKGGDDRRWQAGGRWWL